MKISALIIAKEHSSRLENKNFRDFKGKPMFVWNLEKCLKIFDHVYVSSDSEFILSKSQQLGAHIIKRPKELVGNVPNIPVYVHALSYMHDNPDVVFAVKADSPTIDELLIKSAKEIMQLPGVSELMTCHKDHKIHGSIWALTREKLLSYGNPYEFKPDILMIDKSTDIHTIEDLKKAESELGE